MIRYILVSLGLSLMACNGANAPDDAPAEPTEWTAWKQSGEDGYVNDDLAVLKAVDYRYIPVGAAVFVSRRDSGYALIVDDTEAYVVKASLEPDNLCVLSGEDQSHYRYADLPTDPILLSETQRLRFNLENITHEEKRVRAILYDDNAPELKGFPGLTYFPYDQSGVVTATFKADPNVPEIILDTERGLTKAFYRLGFAKFSISGEDYEMPLYTGTTNPDEIDSFFTGFVDDTTGAETYGTGRYVPISGFGSFPPKTLKIDFNYAYNPYCARSRAYNCPVISFAINAPMRFGESYGKKEKN